MVDHESRSRGHRLAIDELPFGSGLAQVGEGGEPETGQQVASVTLAEPAQRPDAGRGSQVGAAEHCSLQSLFDETHVSTVAREVDPAEDTMPKQRFVKAVIWVVVIAMVLSLAVAVISAVI